MKLGIFYSHPRTEEKALFAAAESAPDVELVKIKDAELELDLHADSPLTACDVVLLRSISHTKNYYAAKFIEARGGKAVNDFHTIAICGDKILTSLKLAEKGVSTPRTKICFDADRALQTIEEWGYPVVLKPVVGSWGRLLSKINDREAAETVLEHKKILGGINHANLFYVQEYLEKKSHRDIRVVVVGTEVVAAMYRSAEHWITNTARGAKVEPLPISDELRKVAIAAAAAVNENCPTGALLGIDLIETKKGLTVVEVNSGTEFHGLAKTTAADLPAKIIEFCREVAQ